MIIKGMISHYCCIDWGIGRWLLPRKHDEPCLVRDQLNREQLNLFCHDNTEITDLNACRMLTIN